MKKVLVMTLLMFLLPVFAYTQDKKEKLKVEDDQSYLVLSTKRIKTIQEELDEAASKGFRVMFGAPSIGGYDMSILLERVREPAEEPYKYRTLATSRVKTMEKEMNEAAQGGYRMMPSTITVKEGFITAELFILMERVPNTNKNYDYKLIESNRETKLHKKIEELISKDYKPVAMVTVGPASLIVMERETAEKLAQQTN